jgi:Holliday junction DNA helicase RuvB
VEDLMTIIGKAAAKLGFAVETTGLKLLAERSRGTPRVAIRLMRRVRDTVQAPSASSFKGLASAYQVEQTLAAEGIDAHGLNREDRQYLSTVQNVYNGGPVGVSAIAATISEDQSTLIDMVEPFLLVKGFIARTKRGRIVTELGRIAITEPK